MQKSLEFVKMHGLGNDFVVVDARVEAMALSNEMICLLADRRLGIGCDQVVVIEPSTRGDLKLSFWNGDASRAEACGNATRCVAAREMGLTGGRALTIETDRGLLSARDAGGGLTSINMGHAMLEWQEIPLSHEVDTLHLPLEGDPVATSMGNPHCTFFVEDAERVALEDRGPEIEHAPLFPNRTNVQFAHVVGTDHVRVRVWERSAGVTPASGSSACAAAVAACRRKLVGPQVRVTLDGGSLEIDWRDDGVWMTGPSAHVFDGRLADGFWDAV